MKLLRLIYHWIAWKTFGSGDPDKHQCDFKHSGEPGGWWVNLNDFEGYYCERTKDHFGEHK
jgi:hypothetical protein